MNKELPASLSALFAGCPRGEVTRAEMVSQQAHPDAGPDGATRLAAGAELAQLLGHMRQLEQELEDQQNLLFQVINSSPNLVYVKDAEGQLMMVNKSCADVLSWLGSRSRPAEAAKKPTPDPALQHPAHFLRQDVTFEENYHLMNGETRRYQTTQCLRQHSDGTNYLLTFSSDITDLTLATRLAEESALSKMVFMANMSHEIRTPLHGVMGLVDLLLKGPLSAEQADYMKMIHSSTAGLLVVINDILDFAKIESSNITLEKIPFNIVETVQEAAHSLAHKTDEKGLLLRIVGLNDPVPLALGDPYRLRQVLVNLISNAVKFTERGSITISINASQRTGTALPVTFSVADTGLGIREENIDRVFESFQQADSNTARLYGGTGLGLTICKNLVEAQGGTIGLRSELGQGSCFYFTIPYTVCTEASARKLADVPAADLLQDLNILFAEDNAINQLIAVSMLGQWRVNVELAQNGEEALAKARRRQYDLILMDIQMPVMDGLEATARLRAEGGPNAATPVIALTADAMRVNADTYEELGFTNFLTKPYVELALYHIIAQASQRAAQDVHPKAVATDLDLGLHYDLQMLGRLADDPSFVRKMLKMFISHVPGQVHSLQEAVEQQNWAAISREAHVLKSTFGMLNIQPEVGNLRMLEELAELQAPKSELLPFVTAVAKGTQLFSALFAEKLAKMASAEA